MEQLIKTIKDIWWLLGALILAITWIISVDMAVKNLKADQYKNEVMAEKIVNIEKKIIEIDGNILNLNDKMTEGFKNIDDKLNLMGKSK